MTPEEYYGNAFPLLKQGEAYLKSLIETYPNACAEDELQSILYVKTRIKSPESMMGKLKKRGLMEDAHTALQSTHAVSYTHLDVYKRQHQYSKNLFHRGRRHRLCNSHFPGARAGGIPDGRKLMEEFKRFLS